MTKKELGQEIERLKAELEVLRVRLACLEAERYMPVVVPYPAPWQPYPWQPIWTDTTGSSICNLPEYVQIVM